MSRITFGYSFTGDDPVSAIEHGILAEKIGFHRLWIPDHFVDFNGAMLDPWTVLSALAVTTKRVMLGSSVTDTQRNHPARTAHSVASLDTISHGRAILGIGAGEAMNIVPFGLPWESPRRRVARLTEAIQIIRSLWTSSRRKTIDFSGRFYRLKGAFLSQSPKQRPYPPIYIGAIASKRTLQLVGRLGDGWQSWLNTTETFRRRWQVIKEAAELSGRSAEHIETSSHIMVAFPRNANEKNTAMLAAKRHLFTERTVLESFGYATRTEQYQNLLVSTKDLARLSIAAKQVPDDMVYHTLAIRGFDDIRQRIDELSKAGVRHFVIADLLAPKGVNRTLRLFRKIIRDYSS